MAEPTAPAQPWRALEAEAVVRIVIVAAVAHGVAASAVLWVEEARKLAVRQKGRGAS